MNKQPIEQARDADLRFSKVALQRAAHQAVELARRMGMTVVVSRDGVVEHVQPDALRTMQVQDSVATYGEKE